MLQRRWHCTGAFVNTLKDFRHHIGTTGPVAALLALPTLFASAAQWRVFGLGHLDLEWVLITGLLTVLGIFTTGVWLTASITYATGEFARGNEPGIATTLARGFVRIPSLLGAFGLIMLLATGALFVGAAPALGVYLLGGGVGRFQFSGGLAVLLVIGILLGLLIWFAMLFFIYFRFAMAPAASVIEKRSPFNSLSRSRELMRGRWVDYFLLALILSAVGFAVNLFVVGPGWLISFENLISLSDFQSPNVGALVILSISTYLTQALNPLLVTGARANFYMALRADEAIETASKAPAGATPDDEPDTGQNQGGAGEDEPPGNLAE